MARAQICATRTWHGGLAWVLMSKVGLEALNLIHDDDSDCVLKLLQTKTGAFTYTCCSLWESPYKICIYGIFKICTVLVHSPMLPAHYGSRHTEPMYIL